MKLTELKIAPKSSWNDISAKNPLRAVVKLNSDDSTVECVLSEETMHKLIDLCAQEIADNAKAQVDAFAAAVTAIEGDKAKLLTQ